MAARPISRSLSLTHTQSLSLSLFLSLSHTHIHTHTRTSSLCLSLCLLRPACLTQNRTQAFPPGALLQIQGKLQEEAAARVGAAGVGRGGGGPRQGDAESGWGIRAGDGGGGVRGRSEVVGVRRGGDAGQVQLKALEAMTPSERRERIIRSMRLRTRTRTHARTHARTLARKCVCAHTHTQTHIRYVASWCTWSVPFVCVGAHLPSSSRRAPPAPHHCHPSNPRIAHIPSPSSFLTSPSSQANAGRPRGCEAHSRYQCVCVCVCVKERRRESAGENGSLGVLTCVGVCARE